MLLAAPAEQIPGQSLPREPAHESGASITGAFEGWFTNPDGTHSLLLGYYNRNSKQELDIPIGPENRIEPGGPDRGQPTHFLTGRQYGLFAVKVPADFGTGKITWTLTANGKTTVIPASLKTEYEISPFREEAVGNTPPVLSFENDGPSVQGPRGLTVERAATITNPLPLTVWLSDDAKWTTLSGVPPRNLGTPVSVRWTQYRGRNGVTFSKDRPEVEKIGEADKDHSVPFRGKSTTTATFNAPGDYVLQVVANDYSGDGGGGEQCCWTTALVKVSVSR
jgi:hypothetical protein